METQYRLCDECDHMEDCQQGYDGGWYCGECMAKLDETMNETMHENDIMEFLYSDVDSGL